MQCPKDGCLTISDNLGAPRADALVDCSDRRVCGSLWVSEFPGSLWVSEFLWRRQTPFCANGTGGIGCQLSLLAKIADADFHSG